MKTPDAKSLEALERGFRGQPSVWVVMIAVVGVLGIVWLVLRLGNDPTERARLPEDAMLAGLALPPRPRPWLGVDVQDIDGLLAGRLGLPDRRGVIVSYVHPGSPASIAGLVQGDVIRRMDETRLRNIDQFGGLLAEHRPGDKLRLVVWHQGALKDMRVTLSSRPPARERPRPRLPEAEVEIEAAWLGLDIVPLSRADAKELGLPPSLRGMLVDDVAPGRGVDAGFLAGDVIIAVNGKPTPTVTDLKEATEQAVGAVVDVIRFGRHVYISVQPPGAMKKAGNRKPPVRQVMFEPW